MLKAWRIFTSAEDLICVEVQNEGEYNVPFSYLKNIEESYLKNIEESIKVTEK